MSPEPLRCAGALIVDHDGRIFFQRRSPHRRLSPKSWDSVGGHPEPGEEVEGALRREYRYVGDDGLIRRIAEEGFAVLRSIGP
ncbi:NUDIX domain-containing protein [Micromonospora sp. GCM10011542]|uniref:NUDIX domain-containing protein n=1 Tax=Micromonospora sp. GCM10011542 TaxID=3317337 RepID=UPI00362279D5